jgi:hypothetical protein
VTITRDSLSNSEIIREPAGNGSGYWVGAPGAFYAADERAWYLTYRIRRPRGIAPDRGGEARIARSTDLKNWQDVWSVTKDQFGSASIERCALRRGPRGGDWHYFASYVDPADGRWSVSELRAGSVEKLSPLNARPLFRASALGLEGIKDPWIFQHGQRFWMFLSVALPTARTTEDSHGTLDIYNTGECLSATGLATSLDLENWQWQGVVFKPDGGRVHWDRYCRRINSLIEREGEFIGFYDGSASHADNYEEKTALAGSPDLRQWQSLNPDGPQLTSAHASGSLRYLDAQIVAGRLHLFFESARPDGAHELRLAVLPADAI